MARVKLTELCRNLLREGKDGRGMGGEGRKGRERRGKGIYAARTLQVYAVHMQANMRNPSASGMVHCNQYPNTSTLDSNNPLHTSTLMSKNTLNTSTLESNDTLHTSYMCVCASMYVLYNDARNADGPHIATSRMQFY